MPISSGEMILGGLMLLVVAFMLRRSFTQSKASRDRDPQKEAHADIHAAESSYAAAINKMELRVNDYAREVEGRIGTKIAVLDRLLAEAETSIKRLEELSQQRPAGENTTGTEAAGDGSGAEES